MSIKTEINQNPQYFNVAIIGDRNVGKTTLIESFRNNQAKKPYSSGVTVDVKQIPFKNFTIRFYDFAGEQKDLEQIELIIKDIKIVCLAFDLSDLRTLEYVQKQLFRFEILKEKVVFIVGCKKDTINRKKEEASIYSAIQNLNLHKYNLYLTSSFNRDGQNELLEQICEQGRDSIITQNKSSSWFCGCFK
ncbi:hypothetical protein pb186bvf_011500 [Paramecium bursaria]